MIASAVEEPLEALPEGLLAGVTPMVLAAGFGTRLRPLTERVAKPVVPFLNRPLLDYTLDWLARCGFERVVVNLHHAPESIARRYGRRGFGMHLEYSREPRILGTGGGLRRALDRLGEEILVVNGDVLTLAPLGPLVRVHRERGALATLGLFAGSVGHDYSQVAATPDGRLASFPSELATAPAEATVRGVFCGVHLVRREAVAMLPEGVFAGIVDHVYTPLLADGAPLAACPLAGSWYEVGDPGRYIDHQLHALRHGAVPLAVAGMPRFVDGGYVAADGHLETMRLRPPFLVGAGVRVHDGAWVQGCVLADRTRVGRGARLQEVISWAGAVIGPGARLRRCVVMEDVRVPADTEATETVFTAAGPLPFGGPGGGP